VKIKSGPVGCVVSPDAYKGAPEFLRTFYEEPYFMAFQHVTKGASKKLTVYCQWMGEFSTAFPTRILPLSMQLEQVWALPQRRIPLEFSR
jgi:hypothetical protein